MLINIMFETANKANKTILTIFDAENYFSIKCA